MFLPFAFFALSKNSLFYLLVAWKDCFIFIDVSKDALESYVVQNRGMSSSYGCFERTWINTNVEVHLKRQIEGKEEDMFYLFIYYNLWSKRPKDNLQRSS